MRFVAGYAVLLGRRMFEFVSHDGCVVASETERVKRIDQIILGISQMRGVAVQALLLYLQGMVLVLLMKL